MVGNIAGAAFSAIELDGGREDTENERVPQEEKRVKLPDRRAAYDRYPCEDKRKRSEDPHRLPQPAFNKVFAHHLMHHIKIDNLYTRIVAHFEGLSSRYPQAIVPSAGIGPTLTH